MARKFLYLVVILIVLVIAGLFALSMWSMELSRLAFVPSKAFVEQPALATNTYENRAMWFSYPDKGADAPARWQPRGATPAAVSTDQPAAVFFIHPTSYLNKAAWNAPLDDADSQDRARLFIKAMASPFARSGQIWAPRYRQAAFGAFLTDKAEGPKALNAAYGDVVQAFDRFLTEAPQDAPIILVGHSQGAHHLIRLLRERVSGTPLAKRIVAAYAIGWPISLDHDLPQLGLPACESAGQTGCVQSWLSFAEPADPAMLLDTWRKAPGLDGKLHGDSPILCSNPLTGGQGGKAPASANLGTLKPDEELKGGELVKGGVPARCDTKGLLLIGDPPDMGAYVLPGNNYHVYDIPLFWANIQADAERRTAAWKAAR